MHSPNPDFSTHELVEYERDSLLVDEYGEYTSIHIKGAKEHNLKNVSLSIPRDKLVVISGLSGSGKSSLAFDTLYAEGQRRYVECLSAYARQFIGAVRKPDVDSIEGLSPAISIEQKSVGLSPRSTVGTVTEIYDYLRLLYAKIGTQYCIKCEIPVQSQSPEQILSDILSTYPGQRFQVLAPLIRGRKGHYRDLFDQLRRAGYTRVRVDRTIIELEEDYQVARTKIHDIELVIDRCVADENQSDRILEAIVSGLSRSSGTLVILAEKQNGATVEKIYSTTASCPRCGTSYDPLAPNSFSFNTPYGACATCDGLGYRSEFDPELMIPDKNLSVEEGGINGLGKKRKVGLWDVVSSFASRAEIPLNVPIKDLTREQLAALLYGKSAARYTHAVITASGAKYEYKVSFAGIIPMLENNYSSTTSADIRENMEQLQSSVTCKDCSGGRLKPEHMAVQIDGRNIHQVTSRSISHLVAYFNEIESRLTPREKTIATLILREIRARLGFLSNVGLDYLTLARSARSLSGGESQRIRLASQIGSQLVGVLYVLDEPSIGLHQHDNYRLIRSLKDLRDLGNTVIVVEHDKEMIENADHLIDIGPKAGIHGGEIMYEGLPPTRSMPLDDHPSITLDYLTERRTIPIPEVRRAGKGQFLRVEKAAGNNLKQVDLEIPLGTFTCITGMSGSGKSTLINDTLYPILAKHFHNSVRVPLAYESVHGLEHIDKVIEIDQTPIGRTPRSNPATYTGVFTNIRDFFSQLTESKVRGYKQGRFSFNVAGGRCEDCEGGGIKKIEMNYLPEVYVPCETCGGKRYNSETLRVTYKGRNIADVLDMEIEAALDFFSEIPRIKKVLTTLNDVGLGYIKLGQQAPTLSGGEAQRVKLATELTKTSTGKTLYLLDEPTTGLHFEDIRLLLNLLNRLVEKGNTVVVIEHNLDVVKCADWIIDLGPMGGDGGGKIVATGTPESVVRSDASLTGKYLAKEMGIER